MARIYSPNPDHSCDYGVDFFNGAAAVPDADTNLTGWFTAKGYTVVEGVDTLTPLDYLTLAQLQSLAPYYGLLTTGLTKAALVAAIEAQLAEMKIEITSFTALTSRSVGTEGEAIYANATAVRATLPTAVYCDAGTVPVPVTTWADTDTYNPNVAGSYTFTATLGTLPVPYANTAAATATIEIIVADDVEITSFDAIPDVLAGLAGDTTYADAAAVIAALPTTVLANSGSVSVPVTTWVDTDTYNPAIGDVSYTFTATLGTLPAGYANTAAVTATVEVYVNANNI